MALWYKPPRILSRNFNLLRNCSSACSDKTGKSNGEMDMALIKPATSTPLKLDKESAAPIYTEKIPYSPIFRTRRNQYGVEVANFALWKASLDKAQVTSKVYSRMSWEERQIHHAHSKAVREGKLTYKDPQTKLTVMTVCQALFRGSCCGNGCRHCPYEQEAVPHKDKKIWNGVFYI